MKPGNVAACLGKGLQVGATDPLSALMEVDRGSLAGVLGLEVVDRLTGAEINRLVRLAWGALRPGGTLILETPNPLSLVVAAQSFWRDLERRRPVHPEALIDLFDRAGFTAVERLDSRPFPEAERLPELLPDELSSELRPLAERLNRIRDDLDELLFGYQLYAIVGKRQA